MKLSNIELKYYNVFKEIPLHINEKDYNNILKQLYTENKKINDDSLNNKFNFIKSKIIEKIFVYINKFNFEDNTYNNVYDFDIINKQLHLLVEIKVNPDQYGKNGKTFGGLLTDQFELLSFREEKIEDYIINLEKYKTYDFYICIFSEPENQLYYINFYKLYNLYINKKYFQFNTSKKSSLFFKKNDFIKQDNFNYILNVKKSYLNYLKKYKDNMNIKIYIKYIVYKLRLYGFVVKGKFNNHLFKGKLTFANKNYNIFISDDLILSNDIVFLNNKDIYFNNQLVDFKHLISKIKYF